MGATPFLIPDRTKVPDCVAQRAYMAGIEQIPWRSRNVLEGSTLTIHRDTNESGHLVIPWQVAGHGETMLRTASLPEQPHRPYVLPVELARGMLSSLTNYVGSWQVGGNQLTPEVLQPLTQARSLFTDAALSQEDPDRQAIAAEMSIQATCNAIRLFTRQVVQQMIGRIERTKPLMVINAGQMCAGRTAVAGAVRDLQSGDVAHPMARGGAGGGQVPTLPASSSGWPGAAAAGCPWDSAPY